MNTVLVRQVASYIFVSDFLGGVQREEAKNKYEGSRLLTATVLHLVLLQCGRLVTMIVIVIPITAFLLKSLFYSLNYINSLLLDGRPNDILKSVRRTGLSYTYLFPHFTEAI